MRVIGFNFTKINIERFKDRIDKIKFNTKIDILSIEPLKTEFLKTKEDIIKIDFNYSVSYEPDYAKLELAGNVLFSIDSKMARELLKGWKNKTISEEFRISLFNVILRKSNIKALQLEDEMGLPLHLPLPSLNKNNKKEDNKNEELDLDKNLKQ